MPSGGFGFGGSSRPNTSGETTFKQNMEIDTPAGTIDAVFTWSLNNVGKWSWRVSLYKKNTTGSPVTSQRKDLHEAPDEILEQLLSLYEEKHDAKQEEVKQKQEEVDSLQENIDEINAALADK
jgi:peptidoglycan hydrolase CwlO-like protein